MQNAEIDSMPRPPRRGRLKIEIDSDLLKDLHRVAKLRGKPRTEMTEEILRAAIALDVVECDQRQAAGTKRFLEAFGWWGRPT